MITSAYAQDNEQSGAGLDEIVVTAQRRESNLQDAPIAVTALSSAALEARGVNVGNLENFAPNWQDWYGMMSHALPGLRRRHTGSRLPIWKMKRAVLAWP